MKALLTIEVPPRLYKTVLGHNVIYRPDLPTLSEERLAHTLAELQPDVLIAAEWPSRDVSRAWRRAVGESLPIIAVALDPDGVGDEATAGPHDGVVRISSSTNDLDQEIITALQAAERAYHRQLVRRQVPPPTAHIRANCRGEVLMVGAGIVNLITAHKLVGDGFSVRILDARPDPRGGRHGSQLGCTYSGDNARMYTLTEADDYHDQRIGPCAGTNDVFRRPISGHGWKISARETPADQQWISDFESVPGWLAASYNSDIFAFNRESMQLWEQLHREEPSLFDHVEFRRGVLRLYSDSAQFVESVRRQDLVGATRSVLTAPTIAGRYPALGPACESGVIVGGIEVQGFTVNIYDFAHRLLAALEDAGAQFEWDTRVNALTRRPDGRIVGVEINGESRHANHYVISPGAYAGSLLAGTQCAHKIHGVLGVWMRLPNLSPVLGNSLKIARRGHHAEDANVTVARDSHGNPLLIIGSGYGYTGADPTNICPDELAVLHAAVEDTARNFFPAQYRAAQQSGLIGARRRLCVRPWTASNLGLFEIIPTTSHGRAVITGGHNTGGFAQAPSVAAAVLAALRGSDHPMHWAYHPCRLNHFHARRTSRAVQEAM